MECWQGQTADLHSEYKSLTLDRASAVEPLFICLKLGPNFLSQTACEVEFLILANLSLVLQLQHPAFLLNMII